jgi:uncharacterized protein (TIGR00369 family)
MTDEDRDHEDSEDSDDLEARRAASYEIPLHKMLGFSYEVPELDGDQAVVRMPVREEAFGSRGNLHGGAIATMVDVACALAAARNSGFDPDKNSLVTADVHIRFLGRPKGDWVEARADVVRVGRQLIVVECKVVDEQERVIASADFSSMLVPLREPLKPDMNADPASPEL